MRCLECRAAKDIVAADDANKVDEIDESTLTAVGAAAARSAVGKELPRLLLAEAVQPRPVREEGEQHAELWVRWRVEGGGCVEGK